LPVAKGSAEGKKNAKAVELEVNAPVLVYPDTEQQQGGVIVEDFGPSAGHAVEVGENRIAAPARRWAVRLNSGDLAFVDSDDLRAL
jgi:hypothetical protein